MDSLHAGREVPPYMYNKADVVSGTRRNKADGGFLTKFSNNGQGQSDSNFRREPVV